MLKAIKWILLVAVVGVAAVVALASTRPDNFSVSRTRLVKAPPERIFPLIEDLRAFNTWNPFVVVEPAMPLSYSGAAKGQGAVNSFGPGKGGTGTLTVVEAQPFSRVLMRLDMVAPLEAHNRVTFTLNPEGEATRVTWMMQGDTPLVGKVVHLLLDMDRMVGGEFDKGLANLARAVER